MKIDDSDLLASLQAALAGGSGSDESAEPEPPSGGSEPGADSSGAHESDTIALLKKCERILNA